MKQLLKKHSVDLQNTQSQVKTRKLNWTQVLYDQNIFIDSQSFRNWNKDLKFQGQDLLQKDIVRTRSSETYMKKDQIKNLLRKVVTFYCLNQKISYQQGLLQVAIPFVLLHKKDFPSRKCYAYFSVFMRKYFPKLLTQKIIDSKKQLPHAMLALNLTQILLRFHYPHIYSILHSHQIPLSMLITPQLLTIFAKNIKIELVYEIYDFFINKMKKNYILYMCIALIGIKEKNILEESDKDQFHLYITKNLKDLQSIEDLKVWFKLSEEIAQKTPKSFQILTKKLGFQDKSIFTQQDLEGMLNFQQKMFNHVMPIYREQLSANLQNFVFVSISIKPPIKQMQSFYISQNSVVSSGIIECCSKVRIIVIGMNFQNQKAERAIFINFTNKIEQAVKKKMKFMIFQQKAVMESKCIIF